MTQLKRTMRLAHATAMVVGIIVGASVFVQGSEITRLTRSTLGATAAWLAAGALTLCGALVCAELASAYPETGGVYVFLRRAFSPALGFLWGWGMFWSMHSGIIAAIAVVMARYAGYFIPLSETGIRLVAIAGILLLSTVNYLGVKAGSRVQVLFTAAKVLAVVAVVAVLFGFGGGAHRELPAATAAAKLPLASLGLAVAAGLFSFGGWHMVTYAAGETEEAIKTIPRALVAGTLIVTVCYVLLNVAYQYVLPVEQVAGSTHVAADAMQRVLGQRGGGLIAVLVVVSAFGSLNGIILAGPRVYYAMAEDGLLFRRLAAVHPRRQTPHVAIAAQAVWATALVAASTYHQLFTRVVYTEWLFFALLGVAVIILRRRPEYRPAFRIPGYPVVPLLFAVASMAVAVNQCVASPRDSAWGLGLLLLGLPVYFVWSFLNSKKAISHAHH